MSQMNLKRMRAGFNCSEDPAVKTYKTALFHVDHGHFLVLDGKIPRDVKCCFKKVQRKEDEDVEWVSLTN